MSQQDPLLGRVLLGQYTIEKRLGAGGFSTIYVADQPSLGRKVAIKTIHPHLATNADTVSRFHREGLAISRLKHPAIVEIFNLGQESDGLLWIAMEYLEGESLASKLQKAGRLSVQEVVAMLKPVCEVLSEAHEQGIVHRDLKPENIMLMAYRGGFLPKVLDFGMASLQEGSSQASAMVGGTFAYMPPEQWQGLKYTDGRSDIYAMGVIAYQCIAGRLPISADEGAFLAWAQKHLNDPPAPLTEAPPPVGEVLYKALQKEQASRQQDIMHFWEELAQASQGSSQQIPVNATAQLGPPPQLRPQAPVNATMQLGAPPGIQQPAPPNATMQLGAPPGMAKPQAPVNATAQLGAPPQLKPQAPQPSAPQAPQGAKPLMNIPVAEAPAQSPIPPAPSFPVAPGAAPSAPAAPPAPNFQIPKSSFDIPKSNFDQPKPQSPIPPAPSFPVAPGAAPVAPSAPAPVAPKPTSPIPAAPVAKAPPQAPVAQAPRPSPQEAKPQPKETKGSILREEGLSAKPTPQAPRPSPQEAKPQPKETKGSILREGGLSSKGNNPNPAASDMVDPGSLRDALSRAVKQRSNTEEEDEEEASEDEEWEPCFTYGLIGNDGTLQMAYYESDSPFELEFEDQEIKVQTDFAPSFTYDAEGNLYCAITTKNGKIFAGTFDDDGYLQLKHVGGDARSNAAPSIAYWDGDLCIAIKGTDNHVYIGHAEDLSDIEFSAIDGESTTIAAPSITTADETLYIAITGEDGLVYITYGDDPEEFGFQYVSDSFTTKQGPSIAYVEDQLYFGLVGQDNKPYLAVMDDDDNIDPWEIGDGYKTKLTPALSSWDGTLYYAMTSTTNKACLALANQKERKPHKSLRFYEVGDGITTRFSPGSANEPPADYYEE